MADRARGRMPAPIARQETLDRAAQFVYRPGKQAPVKKPEHAAKSEPAAADTASKGKSKRRQKSRKPKEAETATDVSDVEITPEEELSRLEQIVTSTYVPKVDKKGHLLEAPPTFEAIKKALDELKRLRLSNDILQQSIEESRPRLEAAAALQREIDALRSENARLQHAAANGLPRTVGGLPLGSVPPPNPIAEKEVFAAAGWSVADRAYTTADSVRLAELLAGGSVNPNCRDGKGTPPLSHAAWASHIECMIVLIKYGCDLEAENLDGATPLLHCVFNKQPKAAALLLAAGASAEHAREDAGAVNAAEVRAVLDAHAEGRPHPLLTEMKSVLGGGGGGRAQAPAQSVSVSGSGGGETVSFL